jgi:hypothetical protein
MPMDEGTVTHSGIVPIIPDVQNPRIQVTIWDVPGETAGLWEQIGDVARTLRHEERTKSKFEAMSYAHLCAALAEALESFGTEQRRKKKKP